MTRKATPEDFPLMLEFYKSGLDELGEEWLESCLVNKIVNSYKIAPSFIYKDVGFAGFTIVTVSHNGKQVLADYMFYVRPEHRSIKATKALVNAAQDFAGEHDLTLRVEFFTQGNLEAKSRMLEMHGLQPKGIIGVT